MFGFVNSALEKLIRRRFGDDKWEEIMVIAKVEVGERNSFQTHIIYKDSDTFEVIRAATEVLGLDADSILEMFGEQFLLWCQESGYAKTLQLLGRSLKDFLTNLDALHDHLSIIYEGMHAPSFRCTEENNNLYLHYYSDRMLDSIVIGVVKSVGRELYGIEVDVSVAVKRGPQQDHTIFLIKEVGPCSSDYYTRALNQMPSHLTPQTWRPDLVTPQIFCSAFPFHIIFNRDLDILQVGLSLEVLLTEIDSDPERNMLTFFKLERPKFQLSFDAILNHINTIYVLCLLAQFSQAEDEMRLMGQMIYLSETDCMLFLCSPRIKNLQDLEARKLFISDIPIHDATRALIIMEVAKNMQFQHAVKLEEVVSKLQYTRNCLEEEKGKMKELLKDMLPLPVAESLMAGQVVEAERFQSVTILFSDIVGFTSIGQKCQPGEVVNMLNELYSLFDEVVGLNEVYKVETIGDAYMVVGGLPIRSDKHAENVCNQALDMLHYCKQVKSPVDGKPINIRVGIHSGMVAAGVVGRRMPRYCLFGDTVNIASRTESNGEAGKIHVTDETYKLLTKNPLFEFQFRDYMQFKNVSEKIATYWLLHNKGRTKRPSLQVPPRVPIFTMHSPPSTPGLMAGTPMSPVDFTRQLSSRLNQLHHHDGFPPPPTIKMHKNPSIVVDSPGHHDHNQDGNQHHEHHVSRVPGSSAKSFGWGCCLPMGASNRVTQDPTSGEQNCHKFSSASNSSQESDGRKDSIESGRKDSHDSGILVNPATAGLQRVPEDELMRHRRPGVCISHQSSNVSELCNRFEKIVDEHKTKQETLARKTSDGSLHQSPIHKLSTVSM